MKKQFLKWTIFSVLGFTLLMACTSKPDARMPEEHVVHFPYTMAQNGQYLAVNGSSADGKYDFGRLLILDTMAIKNALLESAREPIPWENVVKKNLLIPIEAGEIVFSNRSLVFLSRGNGMLSMLPVKGGLPECGSENVQTCNEARNINLFEYDPFNVHIVKENTTEQIIAASYLRSDRIDLIKINASNQVEPYKNFLTADFLHMKLDAKTLANQRFITKKIQTTFKNDAIRGKIYFLVEQHPRKAHTPSRPKSSYLVALKISDLLSNATINVSMVQLWNLADIASINGVRDFFVNENTDEIYVLASVPEALYKINLADNSIIETSVVCTAPTSMAVNIDNEEIVIPCFKDNRVASYSMSTLGLKNVSKIIGRGPAFVVIDKANGLIYCTYNSDGILAIFDDKLNYLGHVFNKAPFNRVGS